MARRRKVGKGELRRFVIAPRTIGRSIGMTLKPCIAASWPDTMDQAGHQDPGLNRGRAPGRDAKAPQGLQARLDSLGPANELVVA